MLYNIFYIYIIQYILVHCTVILTLPYTHHIVFCIGLQVEVVWPHYYQFQLREQYAITLQYCVELLYYYNSHHRYRIICQIICQQQYTSLKKGRHTVSRCDYTIYSSKYTIHCLIWYNYRVTVCQVFASQVYNSILSLLSAQLSLFV